MRRRNRHLSLGVTMMEFTLVAPIILLILFGIVDFGRAIQATTTVADAARQAARQGTANADASDNPFGPGSPPAFTYANSQCSGTGQTYALSTPSGCLTDAALIHTAQNVLGSVTANVTAAPSNNCNVTPPTGTAYVCIEPKMTCTPSCAPAYANCGKTPPGSLPTPSSNPLGDRYSEWNTTNSHPFQGCFLVSVTVVYTFQALTPPIARLLGQGVVMRSSTSIVAEY